LPKRLPKPPITVRAGGQGPHEEAAMMIITVQVDAPTGQATGIKEDLTLYLEKFGDSRVVSIIEKGPEQLSMGNFATHK
jgi:hypothetical protein